MGRGRRSRAAEYKDDSHIIPRSSSVVVKRMPAIKPGKGKAGMYIAGANSQHPTSDSVQRPGANAHNSWHRGAMSKRFDGKEEATTSTPPKPATVRASYLSKHSFDLTLRISLSSSRTISPRRMKPQPWRPCSKLKLPIGKKPRKRCHSWCRLTGILICRIVASCLI